MSTNTRRRKKFRALHNSIANDELPDHTIARLVELFLARAATFYRKGDKVTSELACIKSALSFLPGDVPARAFGPLALKAVRERMIAKGLARRRSTATSIASDACLLGECRSNSLPAHHWSNCNHLMGCSRPIGSP